MLPIMYTKHGRAYLCLIRQVLVETDPWNTHYAVMRDLHGQYAPFLVDLSKEPDFRRV